MKIEFSKFLNYKGLPNVEYDLTEEDCARAFGMSLRRLRRLKGLTLDQLSEQVEIPNPTLNRYESGYNLPSIFMAMKIVNYFDVNIEVSIMSGVLELEDISNGKDTENAQYIEHFVGFNEKLSEALNNKIKVTFNDHKRKKH